MELLGKKKKHSLCALFKLEHFYLTTRYKLAYQNNFFLTQFTEDL